MKQTLGSYFPPLSTHNASIISVKHFGNVSFSKKKSQGLMICLDIGLKEVFPQGRKNLLFFLNLFAKLPRERELCALLLVTPRAQRNQHDVCRCLSPWNGLNKLWI